MGRTEENEPPKDNLGLGCWVQRCPPNLSPKAQDLATLSPTPPRESPLPEDKGGVINPERSEKPSSISSRGSILLRSGYQPRGCFFPEEFQGFPPVLPASPTNPSHR